MEILIKVAQFFLSLSILVMLHELGHFCAARLFGVRVEKFYIFFDPWFSLFKMKRGETEYGIGWLPLGGYVKIAGMIDESMDTEPMKRPPQPYEFRTKPAWQRLIIMVAGVVVNFVLALLIYSMVLFAWGEEYLPTRNLTYGVQCDSLALEMGFRHGDRILLVGGREVDNFQLVAHDILLNSDRRVTVARGADTLIIDIPERALAAMVKRPVIFMPRIPFVVDELVPDMPAAQAGVRPGDQLRAIDGQPAMFFDELSQATANHRGDTIRLGLLRDGLPLELPVAVTPEGKVGIRQQANIKQFLSTAQKDYSLLASIPAGAQKGYATAVSYVKQLKLMFKPQTKAYESLGGFISIGKIFPGVWDWQSFWLLTAFLSIILAIMNILPIPALDGGHVLFLLYEIIAGRKPSDRFLQYAQMAGMMLLFALLLYANGNDIVRLFR